MTVLPTISRATYCGCAALGLVTMLANFAPSPLYGLYKSEWRMSDAMIAAVFSAYSVGTMLVLVLLGGLSDIWGRRRVMRLFGLGVAASLGLMMLAWHPAVLLLGRLLQGLSTGVMTATIAATLMEFHPRGDISAGARINTLTFSLGSALGPVLAGLIATKAPLPLKVPYAAILAALVVCLIAVSALPGEVLAPSAKTRVLRAVRVPVTIRRPFLIACAALLLPNCGQGVIGAFAGRMSGAIGRSDAATAGLIVFVVLAAMAAVQLIFRSIAPRAAILGGAALTCVGWLGVLAAIQLRSAPILWIGVLTTGTASGLCFLGSATLIGRISPVSRRAEVYSAYLMSAFVGMAGSALVAGICLKFLDLGTYVAVMTGLISIGALGLIVTIRRCPRWTE